MINSQNNWEDGEELARCRKLIPIINLLPNKQLVTIGLSKQCQILTSASNCAQIPDHKFPTEFL